MNRGPLANLVRQLARLPGLGEKSGTRLAHFIWNSPGRFAEDLAQAILEVREQVKPCPECGAPSAVSPCEICGDPERAHDQIMVVETGQDVEALEKSGAFRGVYHLLNGTISPLAGRGPEHLRIQELMARLAAGTVREIILATNPSVEGDATASFLEETIAGAAPALAVTRLARGIPVGAELRYLDPLSLTQAVKDRKTKA